MVLNCWPHHPAPSVALLHSCPGSLEDPVCTITIFWILYHSVLLCPCPFILLFTPATPVFAVILTVYVVLLFSKCVISETLLTLHLLLFSILTSYLLWFFFSPTKPCSLIESFYSTAVCLDHLPAVADTALWCHSVPSGERESGGQ